MSNTPKKKEFSDRKADPNVMTSTDFSFVRRHWYVSVKVVAVYLILSLVTYAFDPPLWLYWGFSALCFVAWIYFDYTDIYRMAMRDYNLVKFGYIPYEEKRGLRVGLLAQIPGVLLFILICVTRRGSAENADFFRLLYFILYSPAVNVISALEDTTRLIYLLPLCVIPPVSFLAYKNGYNNIGIMNKIIYKSREKDKRLR